MAKRNGGAVTGSVCAYGLSVSSGHCTFVNPSTNDPRTAIPFGRKAQALTRECGQTRMRQAVAREGGHAKRNLGIARERAIGDPRFRYPIHLRDGDSVWPANVRRLRQCDVIGKGKHFRYGVMAKRNGGALPGDVCSCGLSLGDDHCTFDNPYPDEQPHYRQPQH